MENPLPTAHRAKGASPWLRRLAALLLLSGAAGCQSGFSGYTVQKEKPTDADKELAIGNLETLAKPADGAIPPPTKVEHSFFEWPDWEWSDFDVFHLLQKDAPGTPPAETQVVTASNLTPVKTAAQTKLENQMALAREAYRAQDYRQAERLFHRIADNEKNPHEMVEEAKFYEAESLFLEDEWPKAGDTYMDLMNKFPRNKYRELALNKMFEIAKFWLQDTIEEDKENRQKDKGERWFVMPRFISTDARKPFLDREGRAIQLLEQVRYGDINGPMAEKALFMCGNVKMLDGAYKDAAYYYTQVCQMAERHQDAALAQQATKLTIIAKHMSTGGPDYDGRQAAEARILVQRALENYPELAVKEKEFLTKELVNITKEQAAKDFMMAEFWERTGHLGSAVFYYELVIRRYHGTHPYDVEAAKRRDAILAKIEKEKGGATDAPTHVLDRVTEPAPGPKVLPPDLSVPGR